MPSTYAHRRFGADVLERLPAELQEKIAPYRELYDIGLHGPDLLFYYHAAKSTPVPDSAFPLFVHTKVISIPARIAMTGPPTTGNVFPRSQEGTAITKQTSIPFRFFFKKFMFFPLSHSFIGSYGFPLEIITLDNNNK